MNCEDYVNRYGMVTHELGRPTLHPDDANKATDFNTKQALYRCIGVDADDDYLVLTTGGTPFRALAERFLPTDDPVFWMGDHVRVKDLPTKTGVIYRVGWHNKERQPTYYLRIGTRSSTHRYFAHELERVETNTA